MRCGRPEHQQGEKCAARNAKCKDCHKIGHLDYKVCQLSKRTRRANLAQVTPQDEDDTHIDECGYTQPNPPVVNMLKVINHTGTTSGTQFLKFPIDVDPRGTYKHHLEVSIDTGADVNCMNEKTFKKLFPEVELSVCPHSIQNFGNSTADIYILGHFRTYLRFRGRKYLNTFIVTNANDCPNILSHGAIFRMGILVPNYPEENMVKLEDMETGTSNVFQVLQDLRMKQYQGNSEPKAHRPSTTFMTSTIKPKTPKSCETASQKQVRLYTLIIHLRFRLLSGPCHLPKPIPKPIHHTVLYDQPLEHINLTHTVNPKLVVCMYTNNRARLARQENRQP